MGSLFEWITDWIKEGLIDAITGQYTSIFNSVNNQVADVANQVGQTPQGWNGGVFSMIQNLSETVVIPIAGMILTFVLVYTLYLVTDRQLMSCDSLTEAVEQAILGGCTMIQLREKELSSLEFYNQAVAVKQVTDKYHIPLIINDRIDIAMAVQATGVHIGQHDLPAAAVRKVIGENMLLGVSASSIAEAIQAQQDGADYLGVGAMFPTGTKTDADSVSMEELQKIRAAVSLPIVVIGGINKGNAGRFKPMGIDGLAVVSAIIAQSDIKAAAAELKDLFCGKEKKHGF